MTVDELHRKISAGLMCLKLDLFLIQKKIPWFSVGIDDFVELENQAKTHNDLCQDVFTSNHLLFNHDGITFFVWLDRKITKEGTLLVSFEVGS